MVLQKGLMPSKINTPKKPHQKNIEKMSTFDQSSNSTTHEIFDISTDILKQLELNVRLQYPHLFGLNTNLSQIMRTRRRELESFQPEWLLFIVHKRLMRFTSRSLPTKTSTLFQPKLSPNFFLSVSSEMKSVANNPLKVL